MPTYLFISFLRIYSYLFGILYWRRFFISKIFFCEKFQSGIFVIYFFFLSQRRMMEEKKLPTDGCAVADWWWQRQIHFGTTKAMSMSSSSSSYARTFLEFLFVFFKLLVIMQFSSSVLSN